MRKSLCVGILKESRGIERRAPLTPPDVRWLVKRGIAVEVESSAERIFTDAEYKKAGAKVVRRCQKATLLCGVKEPHIDTFYRDKICMVFSHTIKGQPNNMPLLTACLGRNITLIDYERIVDVHGRRLVYFGRFAGICGLVDSLSYLGTKLSWKGYKNPFSSLKPAYAYGTLKTLKNAMADVDTGIRTKGFDARLAPFIIGITGHGSVSQGVQEILKIVNPIEIHPREMVQFVKRHQGKCRKIYKIVFLREEKFRARDRKGFYFEEYLEHPERFESNLDVYLPYINALIHTSYWDKRYPRMVSRETIRSLWRKKPFRLDFIGDIACDVDGSIALTYKTTTRENPTFTYDPGTKTFIDGYASKGITVMAADNLPSELPGDASSEFSRLVRDYVYQIAAHGVRDLTNHIALPAEIRKAVITQGGKLTGEYQYLSKWLQKRTVLQYSR
jgi:alanine dehydrogenase